MKRIDKVMMIGTFVLAAIWMICIVFGGLGVGVVLGVCAYLGCVLIYGKELNKKQSKNEKWLLVPIGLTTLCFLLFSNQVLRVFNVLFLIGLLLIHAIEYFGRSDYKIFLPEWCKDVIRLGITLPFAQLDRPAVLIKGEVGVGKREKIKVVGKVLVGILLAFPILLIVVGLLVSSDAAFEEIVDMLLRSLFSVDLLWLFARGFTVIILFFILFSYFYGLIHSDEEIAITNDAIEVLTSEKKGLDFIIVATVTTLLCFIYLIFFLSQSVYFISAFEGVLPKGFDFASEYARRGFFETLPLAGFNLIVIFILGRGTDFLGSLKKKYYARGIICFITAFTLFMVTCALAKMVMYMQEFGLTMKRVQVAWFLCVIVIMVIFAFIKLFVEKFTFIRNLFIAFTIMYLGFNYVNVDYIVSSYNVGLYKARVTNNLSGCYDLGPAAMIPISKMIEEDKRLLKDEEIHNLVQGFKREANIDRWQWWNVTDYKVCNLLEDLMKK